MLALLPALALSAALAAPPPARDADADALFDHGRYAAALPLYEARLRSADAAARRRALFRAVECEALLFRYLEAAARAEAAPLPDDPLWRGRLLLLRAEAEREALRQYGRAAPEDAAAGSPDLARRTAAQWRAAAASSYAALYPLRQALSREPLARESYFVDTRGADLAETPTLWDLAALRWTGFLQERARDDKGGPKPDALELAAPAYPRRWSERDPALAQAAALMEESSRLGGRGRALARELWKLRRAALPLSFPGLVRAPADVRVVAAAVLATRRRWVEQLSQPGARAQAGYEAAQQLEAEDGYAEAVGLCRRLERDWPTERASRRCAQLRARIELPSLTLEARPAPPPGKGALRLATRNLDGSYVRLFKTTPEELAALWSRPPEDWSALRTLPQDALASLAARKPDLAWRVPAPSTAPYARARADADPPAALAAGLYVALASSDERFAPGRSLLSGAVVDVTDLLLFASAGPSGPESDFVFDPDGPKSRTAPAFHYYALDAASGEPARARITALARENWAAPRRVELRTGEDGAADLPATFSLAWGQADSASADALAERDGSFAYTQAPLWVSHPVPAPLRLFVDLDRPVYRPGQRLRGKLTALRRLPRGLSAYAGPARATVSVSDASGRLVSSATVSFDAYGAAEFAAELPPGRLLGRWSVSAQLAEYGSTFYGGQSFSVEEYKRPEFEVTLAASTGPWRYGFPAQVSGEAKYYFGAAVPDAPVAWRVVRRDWLPWFCWWWRPRGGDVEVAAGQARTDAAGRFAFAFTPRPSDEDSAEPRPSEFVVTAQARDAGGRTIEATRSYRAGAKAYLFAIEPPAGFLRAGAASEVSVRLMTLEERATAGRGRFELRRVTGVPKDPAEAAGLPGAFPQTPPPLERLFEDAADGAVVASGPLDFPAGGSALARLPPLKEGVYRLAVSADDPWGGRSEQKIVLLSVSRRPSASALPLPAVALPEHASYLPGETARLLVGSSKLDSGWLEVWGGSSLLERRRLNGGLQLVDVRVGDAHAGGFTARWFGVRDFRAREGEAFVDVPRADKRLSLVVAAPAAVKPGEKVSWAVSVRDSRGRPVDAQALVRVFDRSLEYYAEQGASWLGSLYASAERPAPAASSLFAPWAQEYPISEGEIEKMLERFREAIEEPQPPRLRLDAGRVYSLGRGFGLGGAGGGVLALSHAGRARGGMMAAAAPENAPLGAKAKSRPQAEAAAAPPPAARADFSETAYFEPRLELRRGRGKVSFTMPERLTSWKVQAAALTRDAAGGEAELSVAARKDLMVRLELPRFLREGDAARLLAVVHNETDQPLTGAVSVSVVLDSSPAESVLGLAGLEKPFTVAAHSQAAFSWPVRAPRGGGTFAVTAVARAGALADAERRELPLLPSRQRLVESAFAALDGTSSAALRLPRFFEKDPTRRNESLTLELEPQLALPILSSLPFLVRYPYECVEQVLDRYVPLSIVEALYRRDPRLAQAVSKVPRRKTRTLPWDRSDPRRLARLMESPWEQASRGGFEGGGLVDLLDPALVERERAEAQQKLLSYQGADGSYSWFPGGAGDPYMTLLVLSGWAEAQRYGVEIPVQAARRALSYVERELPAHLEAEPGELSLTLFGAYVLTSYPAALPESKDGYRLARAWADYADRHKDALTPVGRAYAAHVWRALGQASKSEDYLDRALDGARRDPVAGVYWQPEKLSWLWYNDTVETHAFLLKTLLELRPRDPLVAGMVRWLLLNRVGNQWKSTKASAAAIYALLEVLRARGALDRGDAFTVAWGTQTLRLAVEPLERLDQAPRFTREGSAIGPRDGAARVEKTGPGLSFASLTWLYSSDEPAKASGPGLTALSRRYFRRVKQAGGWRLEPLESGEPVAVGDELEVHLTVTARAPFEYVQLRDPKPAGVEAEALTSGWRWDRLGRYEEPRDSLTNFFMSRLPHGEYVLSYRVRPTAPGRYRAGAAVLQSMYAPEIAAHSDDFVLDVRP